MLRAGNLLVRSLRQGGGGARLITSAVSGPNLLSATIKSQNNGTLIRAFYARNSSNGSSNIFPAVSSVAVTANSDSVTVGPVKTANKKQTKKKLSKGKNLDAEATGKDPSMEALVPEANEAIAVAAPLSEQDLKVKQAKLQKQLNGAHRRGEYFRVTGLLFTARTANIPLDTRDYVNGIASMVHVPKATKMAHRVYGMLKSQNVLPLEVFVNMLKICRMSHDIPAALEIVAEYKERYGPLTEQIFTEVLLLLSTDMRFAGVARTEQYYSEFRQLEQERGWKSCMKVYIAMARMYIRLGDGDAALRVLKEMTTDAQYEPTAYMCNDLLEPALFAGQAKVLRVLAHWNAESFQVRLDNGVLNKMLQIGATGEGDSQLAQLAFKMQRTNGYDPSQSNYECLARAALLEGDVITAVEVLQEMQAEGFGWDNINIINSARDDSDEDMPAMKVRGGATGSVAAAASSLYGTYGSRSSQQRMQAQLVDALCSDSNRKAGMLDKLYYALLDQIKGGGGVVPRVVLDAIVESAGRLEVLDRAFATFQEYQGLFGVTPDVNSYNALLAACAAGQSVNMHTLLSVVQDIEANGCVPDSYTFGLLLEGMCDAKDFRVLDDVLLHCTTPVPCFVADSKLSGSEVECSNSNKDNSSVEYNERDTVVIPPRALRRVIVAFAKDADWTMVERLLVILDRQQSGRQHTGQWISKDSSEQMTVIGRGTGIPAFLVKRLERIKARQDMLKHRKSADLLEDTTTKQEIVQM